MKVGLLALLKQWAPICPIGGKEIILGREREMAMANVVVRLGVRRLASNLVPATYVLDKHVTRF